MTEPASGRRKALVFLIALLLTVWGVLGMFGRTEGYTDALFEPDYTILHVPPDGVLAEAGFQPGDSVVSVEGIPVAELGMYSRWPRSLSRAPGEPLNMVVDRDGELVNGQVVAREQPPSVVKMRLGFLTVLLAFLWAGVWALFAVPGVHSMRLAGVGLAAGFGIPGPNMGSWSGFADHINVAAEVLWLLLLFRFFLFFPKPKRIAQSHLSTAVIYAPWVIYLGCLVVELIFHPRFYHSFGGFMGLLLLGYTVLALVALVHGWIKTPKGEVGPSGLGTMLTGVGIGLGGVLIWAVDAMLLQGFDIPGSNWAPVLFGVIPVAMALGLKRGTR